MLPQDEADSSCLQQRALPGPSHFWSRSLPEPLRRVPEAGRFLAAPSGTKASDGAVVSHVPLAERRSVRERERAYAEAEAAGNSSGSCSESKPSCRSWVLDATSTSAELGAKQAWRIYSSSSAHMHSPEPVRNTFERYKTGGYLLDMFSVQTEAPAARREQWSAPACCQAMLRPP